MKVKENLHHLESDISLIRKGIQDDFNAFKKNFNLRDLLERAKELLQKIVHNKKALLIIGAATATFIVIRLLLGSGSGSRRNAEVTYVRERRPSWISSLLWAGLRSFLLYYLQKQLIQYLDEKRNKLQSPENKPFNNN